jgi:hypothetical protein
MDVVCKRTGRMRVVTPPDDTMSDEIWPNWNEGVPTKLRKKVFRPTFWLNGVRHLGMYHYESLELEWNKSYKFSEFKGKCNDHLLPKDYTSEWSGIYRILSSNKTIDRLGGKDPTGTLYVGRAGGTGKNWSILRTRIISILNGEHHAMQNWHYNALLKQMFPMESLAIEWAVSGLSTTPLSV